MGTKQTAAQKAATTRERNKNNNYGTALKVVTMIEEGKSPSQIRRSVKLENPSIAAIKANITRGTYGVTLQKRYARTQK
jgi:anti-sigma28 factor (negative regulator of flagellin synthesis)